MSVKSVLFSIAALFVTGGAVGGEFADFLSPQWSFVALDKGAAREVNTVPAGAVKFSLDKNFCTDFDVVSGKKYRAMDECIVYNEFTLDKEQTIALGMGADWWFEAYLNGKVIHSAMDYAIGNGKNFVSYKNHILMVKGKKGKNVLAVFVRMGKKSHKFACKALSIVSADQAAPLTITGDAAQITGNIKLMNGASGGPFCSSGWDKKPSTSLRDWLEMRIPYVRNHDVAHLSGFGGPNIVDVHMIFPDFSKDPTDPASYDFTLTDRYMQWMQQGNSKVFYRLGASIEHAPKKYGTKVPPDYKKWAVICEHIIRHYNEGWANGFRMNIEYWEIWNEADISSGKSDKKTWQGTDEQFFEFYRVAALHLKKSFPKLKIGGPSGAGDEKWAERFLKAMTTGERVPMDFFSWHIYCCEPEAALVKSRFFREMLDRFGYKETESILNEWNYVRTWRDMIPNMKAIHSLKGAIFTSGMMCVGQNMPVDMMMYYFIAPNTSWNGTAKPFIGERQKSFYSFVVWAKLLDLGRQIKLDIQDKNGLYAVAATNGQGKVGILLVRYTDEEKLPDDLPVTLKIRSADLRGIRAYLLDDDHDLEEISSIRASEDGTVKFTMKANTLIYLEN